MGSPREGAPPRLAQWLLAALLGARDRQHILGDLAEEYRRRRGAGRWQADLWYWRQLFRSAGPALWRRLGAVVREAGSSPGHFHPGALAHDIRFGVRSLLRSPGLTAAVVLVLALGIGANSAVFSGVHAVLLQPLPYADAERLVAVWPEEHHSRQLLDWARDGTEETLEDLAGYGGELLTLTEAGPPSELFVMQVTINYLDALGVEPALGRGFLPEDGLPGAEAVVILSHELWRSRFAGDADVLGRSIALGGEGASRRTVVGVMSRDHHPLYGQGVQAWIPVVVDRSSEVYGGSSFMSILGRLRPGATLEQARAQIVAVAESAQERDPGQYSRQEVATAGVELLGDELAREVRPPILVAFAGVLLVLLVACGNVALLLLARAASRGRELSVRAALGAGRVRLMRQAVVESLLLALVGAGSGLGLAYWALPVLEGALPRFVPPDALSVNGAVVAFAMALAVGSALVGSFGPALAAARRDPAEVLTSTRGSRGDRREGKLRLFLVGAQLAMATTLVAGAALLAKSGQEMLRFDPGFRTDGVMTFRVTLPPTEHPSDESVNQFYREATRALNDVPGVAVAGFVSRMPMGFGTSRISISPEGYERGENEAAPTATHRLVTPGYLEAIEVTLVEGRLIEDRDTRGEGPLGVVVNRTLAERFWPEGSPLGRAFYGRGGVVWLRVVGVIEDLQEYVPGAPPDPAVYIAHTDWAWRTMHAVAQVQGDPELMGDALQEAVWSVSPGAPVSRLRTLEAALRDRTGDIARLARFGMVVSAFALLLGSLGIYGVVAYAVRMRLPELGVRAALGASRRTLLKGEIRRHGGILVVGTAVGLGASVAGGRLLESVLYGVSAHDPLILGGVAALLGTVGLTAIWLPARRGAAVDPVEALRAD